MPSKKTHLRGVAANLNAYPAGFLGLANAFEGDKALRIVTIECESESAARRRRWELYNFKRTIDRCDRREDYPNFMRTRLAVSGCKLTVAHVDDAAPEFTKFEEYLGPQY